jgi:hypothetical protein
MLSWKSAVLFSAPACYPKVPGSNPASSWNTTADCHLQADCHLGWHLAVGFPVVGDKARENTKEPKIHNKRTGQTLSSTLCKFHVIVGNFIPREKKYV